MCVCECMCVCEYVCECMYVCMYVCMCVSVYECVIVSMWCGFSHYDRRMFPCTWRDVVSPLLEWERTHDRGLHQLMHFIMILSHFQPRPVAPAHVAAHPGGKVEVKEERKWRWKSRSIWKRKTWWLSVWSFCCGIAVSHRYKADTVFSIYDFLLYLLLSLIQLTWVNIIILLYHQTVTIMHLSLSCPTTASGWRLGGDLKGNCCPKSEAFDMLMSMVGIVHGQWWGYNIGDLYDNRCSNPDCPWDIWQPLNANPHIAPLYCCTIILLYYHTVVLSYCCTIILLYYHTVVLSYCCTIILLYYHTVVLSYCCTIILLYYHTVVLSYCCTIILLYYHTVVLSYCCTIILLYYHTVVLSYCCTVNIMRCGAWQW